SQRGMAILTSPKMGGTTSPPTAPKEPAAPPRKTAATWSGSSDAGELVSDSWSSQGRLGSLDGFVTFLERREGVKGGRFSLERPIQFDPIAVADFSGRSH